MHAPLPPDRYRCQQYIGADRAWHAVLTIAIGLGVGLGLIGLAPNVPAAFGLLAAIGVGAGFINVHVVSWLQGRTPEDMRGRVMSMVSLGSVSLAPLSYALAGAIVDLGAVTAMFAVAGAIVAGAALVGFASGVAGRMTYAADEGPRSVL